MVAVLVSIVGLVIAAGAWSNRFLRQLGTSVLLDAERGYHIMLPQPDPGLRMPVNVAQDTIFLSPMEHGLRLTTGVELAGTEAPPDYTRARRMLGRPYTVRGPVVEGDRRGHQIGFPTANVAPENEVLPAPGVYAGHVLLLDDGGPARGTAYPAVTNVGRRPTFGSGDEITVEAHLIGYEGDLYGRRIDVAFEHHLREEQRFSDADALKQQIARDVAEARRRLVGA